MKNITAMPSYKLCEYLLVLNPHEELRNKIMNIKKEFYESYKASAVLFGKRHLTLVSFVQYEIAEKRSKEKLHFVAMGSKPVKIELKDYGSF